jgi:uncharacterized membrane protein SpoIIM required for sporulation
MLVMLEGWIMVKPHQRYLLWYIMVGLLVTVALLVRMGARIFNREELLGRSLDQLSFRWAFRMVRDQIRGPLGDHFTVARWYRLSVFPTLRSLRRGAVVVSICMLAAVIGGWMAANTWVMPLEKFDSKDATLVDRMQSWLEMGQDNPQLVILAAAQNIRVLIAATILGVFTFGVLALVLIMIPFGIYGFIMGQVIGAGLSPLPFIMAIIPHGIIEIPAILIAGAAALRLGSIVTRPPEDMTVGEAWLRALGDAIKIGIGVVLPLLVVAAMLEVWVTPQVVQFVLTH